MTKNYPKGGTNLMWEPLHLDVTGLDLPGITIQGRTEGRDGLQIMIFYKGELLGNHSYNYHQNLGYDRDMAREAAEDINIIYDILGMPNLIARDQLYLIMKAVRTKCESRYGNRLPDSDYEVLVNFN